MAKSQRTVLITGCSEGGMGHALALAFHQAGLKVVATARNTSKMSLLRDADIETQPLDVLSEASIMECVRRLSSLDILVNNAGTGLTCPLSDTSLVEAREVFELNVWAPTAMMQACLPLLLKSDQAMVVNHTSPQDLASRLRHPVQFQAIYNASKAALSMLSDTFRLETEAFGIRVVELKTGGVATNFLHNLKEQGQPRLRFGSIYEPAREKVDRILKAEAFEIHKTTPQGWATAVVSDVLRKNPPAQIYRGDSAWYARVMPMLPFGTLDGMLKRVIGVDVVERMLKA